VFEIPLLPASATAKLPAGLRALHRMKLTLKKHKASGWQQGTAIAIDQLVAHVASMK
jgi:hypothetical protein